MTERKIVASIPIPEGWGPEEVFRLERAMNEDFWRQFDAGIVGSSAEAEG